MLRKLCSVYKSEKAVSLSTIAVRNKQARSIFCLSQ